MTVVNIKSGNVWWEYLEFNDEALGAGGIYDQSVIVERPGIYIGGSVFLRNITVDTQVSSPLMHDTVLGAPLLFGQQITGMRVRCISTNAQTIALGALILMRKVGSGN